MVLVALLACVPKHEPVRLDEPRTIEVVAVLETRDDAPATDPPAAFDRAIEVVLQARNLQPTVRPTDLAGFSARRDTRRRLDLVGGTSPVLLVEAEAGYFSEISGKYRWTVDVRLTLAPSGLEDRFSVPVFLQYPHEGAETALVAAAPVVARRVGLLADNWLSAP